MIVQHQPLMDGLVVGVSSRDEGTMLDRTRPDRHDAEIVENRRQFCSQVGIDYGACVYQIITYGPDETYDLIGDVSTPDDHGVHADVLYTETPGLGLFLPIADCVGTVLYDPRRHALAVAHLGRHASVAKTIQHVIEHFVYAGSQPGDLRIWMAPSVSKMSYVMEYFDHQDDPDWRDFVTHGAEGLHIDMAGFNARLARRCGVRDDQISLPITNTAEDTRYFSHSQGDTTGRFAVVACLRSPREL